MRVISLTLLADSAHGATAAQVAIAWLQDQESVITIPKAARPSSQRANLDALDIRLDDEDCTAKPGPISDTRVSHPTRRS